MALPPSYESSSAKPYRSLVEAMRQAFGYFQSGNLVAAERACRSVLAAHPRHFDALHLLGTIAARMGRFRDAHRLLTEALAVNPSSAEAHSNLGNVQRARGAPADAVRSYDRALALNPALVDALINRGGALKDLQRFSEALESYDRSLAQKPDSFVAHYNRGTVLSALKRHDESLASYDRALALKADFAEALNNRGCTLAALKRHPEALASYDRALRLQPAFAEALQNRAVTLSYLGRHEDAVTTLVQALKFDPELPFARGTLLHSRMHCCEWRDYEESVQRIIADVRARKRACEPFMFLPISDSDPDQLGCAETWALEQCPIHVRAERGIRPRYDHDRIRVAYVSSDFRNHPLGHLMSGLFERHDRSRFEVIALSMGPDDGSAMRSRLERAFDWFIDVRERSDRGVAELMRELEVDIAVDRNGYTTGARPGIFALRAAPIQVNYLAYPGTTGADYIDYIVADDVVIPREHQRFYSEKVVYLPDSYQVNDSGRRIAQDTPTRIEAGLPERGFVFCSFNNHYKITPRMFDLWMRLLKQIEGSVLWLLTPNATARRNLEAEASCRGMDPRRLVFARRIVQEQHLARQRLADLFLDTLPCNAHTTASDALWAGLPVLTCAGTTFAGRVGASLLRACGLPELVTGSLGDYESLALRLASEPAYLEAIRRKLARNRLAEPLFDTDRFRRHIETAYRMMWERHQRGEAPAGFDVPSED